MRSIAEREPRGELVVLNQSIDRSKYCLRVSSSVASYSMNMWGPDPFDFDPGSGRKLQGGYYFDYGNYYDYGGTFREPRTWNDSSCDFDGFPCLCKTPAPCDA